MTYVYHAVDVSGANRRGQIDAVSKSKALEKLEHEGLTPLSIDRASNVWAKLQQPVHFGAESSRRLLPKFTLNLASLLMAGVPVSQALAVLEEGDAGESGSLLAGRLRQRLATGQRFAAAIELDEIPFPDYYVAIAATSEEAGDLPVALHKLGRALDDAQKIQRSLKTALIYPCFLLAVVALTISLLTFVVLPRFEPLFAGAESSLPWLTQWVLAFGKVLTSPLWLWFTAIIVVVAIILGRSGIVQKKHFLRVVSYLPVIGSLRRDIYLGRWARTLGTLTKSGISLVRACQLANPLIDSLAGAEIGQELVASLRRGERLVAELTRIRFVPPFATRLIMIGEESGRLPEMLEEAANLLSQRADESLKRIIAFAVPTVTLVLGGMIAVLVGAVFLGVLSLNQLVAAP